MKGPGSSHPTVPLAAFSAEVVHPAPPSHQATELAVFFLRQLAVLLRNCFLPHETKMRQNPYKATPKWRRDGGNGPVI